MYTVKLRKDMSKHDFLGHIMKAEEARNYPAIDEKDGFCKYRTIDGKRACLAGTFIPDEEYKGEGNLLFKYGPYINNNAPEWLTIELLGKLQQIHDTFARRWNFNMFLEMVKIVLEV